MHTFLTNAMQELTTTWIRGITYEFSVACPCNDLQQTVELDVSRSRCLHLLPLEECLNQEKIKCRERQMWIETDVFRAWFQEQGDGKQVVSRGGEVYLFSSFQKVRYI